MADMDNVARPYAQAILELAQEAGDYSVWSDALAFASAVANDPTMQELARNPRVERKQLTGLFEEICGDRLTPHARNLLKLVVHNGRLWALPAIAAHFEKLRAEAEGTVEAQVVAARDVNESQLAKLASGLEKRLGRKVNLSVRRDDTLLGGAIVRAGDLVIDGSARGRLQKLAAVLLR